MTTLTIIRTVVDLRAHVRRWRSAGDTVALAPTMGALHAGHLSLVALASSRGAKVVASLFVNPAQFAPGEDFLSYPRDEAADAALLAEAGCHLLYAPTRETIYPAGFSTRVIVEGPSEAMEGAARPGHFEGVATVVAKLLIQAAPDLAVFGEKDYQQLTVIRRLAADLDLPVEIIAASIVRDADGLALSSRNVYLTKAQRAVAPALYRVLREASRSLASGAAVDSTERTAVKDLLGAGFDDVDYFETRLPGTLDRLGPGPVSGEGRLLAAARLGKTRLLDNVPVAA